MALCLINVESKFTVPDTQVTLFYDRWTQNSILQSLAFPVSNALIKFHYLQHWKRQYRQRLLHVGLHSVLVEEYWNAPCTLRQTSSSKFHYRYLNNSFKFVSLLCFWFDEQLNLSLVFSSCLFVCFMSIKFFAFFRPQMCQSFVFRTGKTCWRI